MSEQDKRPLYMGTYERHRKELQVKHDDILLQLALSKKVLRYALIMSAVALILSISALAM
jgi:hypothetical protein